ncbi:MAG TPA: [acyl-carrier-protein] S-malonyltransferase [Desulfobacteraceae bacterium]|nr:[acyl-carrier-protein] S-malonyltransferase [Desulfobacteraceae bacterium]
MPEKIAYLFPGQGSQFVGMGRDLLESFPTAKEIFQQTDEICERPISRFCFEGPMEELTLTETLQPAITAVNLAALAALQASGVKPFVSAGHSLGEYAALVSAGVLQAGDALRLVRKRGELMHRESLSHPGTMAAVLGLPIETVERIVDEAKGDDILAVANHNTAEQIVITGQEEPVSRAVQAVKKEGAKAIPLKVSGAWHCRLMEGAVAEFREFMEQIPFSPPATRMFFNATGDAEADPEAMKDIMAKQLVSPVKWYDIVQQMVSEGVQTFVEVGPKKVLTGLVRKIVPKDGEIRLFQVDDSAGLEKFLARESKF